jgi:hypothetical protein
LDDVWPLREHYEPLLIFVCLPYSNCTPGFCEIDLLLEELQRLMLWGELPEAPPVQ